MFAMFEPLEVEKALDRREREPAPWGLIARDPDRGLPRGTSGRMGR